MWCLFFWILQAEAKKVTLPVDIGIGPAIHTFTGPVAQDQMWHYGLVLSVQAIIDKKTLKQNKKMIPPQYRKMVLKMEEIRISPSIFIPDTLFISPKFENTSIYGISFRPFSLGLPLIRDPFRFALDAGLRLSYAWVEGDTLGTTHFLRPGLDGGADLEIPFSKSFLTSVGWDSQLYIPQIVGGGVFEAGPLEEDIWHIGQAYFKLHFRVPVKVKL